MDDYSGSIDWDQVYSAFHDPRGIADRIDRALGDCASSVLFSGFPEVASCLARERPLRFVDHSPVVCTRTQERYPEIRCVTEGEITKVLANDSAQIVVIACRVSAFWQSPQMFVDLVFGLLSHPRKKVLIDFFDRDAVSEGEMVAFGSAAGRGMWQFQAIRKVLFSVPPIYRASMNVSYEMGTTQLGYRACRAYFRSVEVETWFKERFPEYSTTVSCPLLDGDPSFLIKLEL